VSPVDWTIFRKSGIIEVTMNELTNLKLTPKTIKDKRAEVSRLLTQSSPNIQNGDIKVISSADLKLLFDFYDKVFLRKRFKNKFKGKLRFSLSRRMTRSAGKTLFPANLSGIKPENLIIEIRMGVDFFFSHNLIEGSKNACGIQTKTALEALQVIFEHELCHAIEYICFGQTNCSGDRFKTIAGNLFGHTESHHSLPTNTQIAHQKLGLKIGDNVGFTFEGKRLKGILYKINKRAVVMVPDKNGQFADSSGNKYAKYYVPLPMLE
jgi:hypothetical protein